MIIWHNGIFKNVQEFHFHLSDRVRYGDGLFDTMLSVDGNLIWHDLHIARLYKGAETLRIPIPYAEDDFYTAAKDIVRINNLTNGKAVINTIVSRGSAPRGLMPPDAAEAEIIIMASAAPKEYPPVHAVLPKTVRRNEGSPLSQIKSFNYGDHILALLEAKEQDANEAILLNNAGRLTCASAGNIYILRENMLLTPPLSDGVMAGIVRQKLILNGFAKEQSLTPDNLKDADGVFISNSVRGLFPVITLDGKNLSLAKLTIDPHFHCTIKD